MAEPTHPVPSPIETNAPCIHCGYILRGLLADANCPECGNSISASLRGDLLRFAEPAWLRRIAFGVWVLRFIFLGLLICFLIAMASPFLGGIASKLISIVVLLLLLLGVWASFNVSAAEPRRTLSDDPAALRGIVRTSALVGAVPMAIESFVWLPLPFLARQVMVWSSLLGILVVIVGLLLYLRDFARRLPDKKLQDSAAILMWMVPGTLLASLIITRMFPNPAGRRLLTSSGIGAFISLAHGLASLFVMIYCPMVVF